MTRWRLAVAMVLCLAVGLPLAAPFVELAGEANGWRAWTETSRITLLAVNSLYLASGTLALALPAGIVGAILLYRTDLPLRGLWRFLLILTLFVPLPLVASAWQATLGSGGWLPTASWSTLPDGDPDVPSVGPAWKPWAQGIGAAAWIHAVAAIPWVIWIVGQGLCWVEIELEEDALLVVGRWRVLWAVTLRRSWAAIEAAALWIVLQTATDITVTDMMQVRTFAEEVYYQFVLRDSAALARSVAVSVPAVVVIGILVLGMSYQVEKSLPPLQGLIRPPLVYRLGRARWLALGAVLAGLLLLAGVPLASLVWKSGLSESPEVFSFETVWQNVFFKRLLKRSDDMELAPEPDFVVFGGKGWMIAASLVCAGLAGGITAGLALLSSWLATEAHWFRIGLLVLMSLCWALPGPVIGLGLKNTFEWIMEGEEGLATLQNDGDASVAGKPQDKSSGSGFRPLKRILYLGPSIVPLIWVSLIRFFPCALVLVWPIVRLVPCELRDAVRVDGARPWQEFRLLIWPLLAPAFVRAALAVAILSLGEISAGKLVETPGSLSFAHELFNQMHYGVTSHLAALCLVLLLLSALGGSFLAVSGRIVGGVTR